MKSKLAREIHYIYTEVPLNKNKHSKTGVNWYGKSFDAVMVKCGNSLENMQKRADGISAKLTGQSNRLKAHWFPCK